MFSGEQVFECVAKINIIYKLMLWSITQNRTNKCDLLKKTMSPSQWQLSGSCLPLLCSLVHTLRMPHFKEDLKIQVRNQNENAGTIQPITIFPQFGWGVCIRRLEPLCLQQMELLVFQIAWQTKTSKNQIESIFVYKNGNLVEK